jgi:membrane protease YdiL (CAAX protease family)
MAEFKELELRNQTMISTAAAPFMTKYAEKPLKPMGLFVSLLHFGIPAAALAFCLLWLWPFLMASGMSQPAAYTISLGLVNTGLIMAALVGYIKEGNPLTWAAFRLRMRLSTMTGRVWLWAVASALVVGVLSLLVNTLAVTVYKAIHFTMPDIASGATALWMNIVILLLNILGEELWWRGYILPRQELAFGKYTWLIHGILWACFHMFKWWSVPFMLITCQVIPFVAQRTRSTWPGVISHLFVNGAGILMSLL